MAWVAYGGLNNGELCINPEKRSSAGIGQPMSYSSSNGRSAENSHSIDILHLQESCSTKNKAMCNIITDTNGPFKLCGRNLLQKFQNICSIDVCTTNLTQLQSQILCNYLSFLTQQCMELKPTSVYSWRNDTFCRKYINACFPNFYSWILLSL